MSKVINVESGKKYIVSYLPLRIYEEPVYILHIHNEDAWILYETGLTDLYYNIFDESVIWQPYKKPVSTRGEK